ncbi:MAG: hypothetical protein RBT45_05025 [Acholeplasmataceae bacterium]|nr:hypothetical protein [Acholeplasmataceae bacterium]
MIRKNFCNTESIDKVLDYIQHDIESADDQDVVSDLIDVHNFLTKLKVEHISKVVTEDVSDMLLLYTYITIDSFKAVFGNWESHTTIMDDRVILSNDLIYMDINIDTGYLRCIISFNKNTDVIVVGEVINTLKDIFGSGLHISSELFVVDESTKEYIWGEENIDMYLRGINGTKVKPIIVFNDDTVGNC